MHEPALEGEQEQVVAVAGLQPLDQHLRPSPGSARPALLHVQQRSERLHLRVGHLAPPRLGEFAPHAAASCADSGSRPPSQRGTYARPARSPSRTHAVISFDPDELQPRPANMKRSPGFSRAAKVSSTRAQSGPRRNCTRNGASLVIVPIDMRCRRASVRRVTYRRPVDDTTRAELRVGPKRLAAARDEVEQPTPTRRPDQRGEAASRTSASIAVGAEAAADGDGDQVLGQHVERRS